MSDTEAVLLNGDTYLHKLLANESYATMSKFIIQESNESILRMLRTANDNGDIPLDLLIKRTTDVNFTEEQKIRFAFYLCELIAKVSNEKLADQLDLNTIMQPYKATANQTLIDTMTAAILVANEIRSNVQDSTSHPQFNKLDKDAQKVLQKRFSDMYFEINKTQNKISNSNLAYIKPDLFSQLELDNKVTSYKKNHLANCQGLSEYAFDIFKLQISQLPSIFAAEVYVIPNGDHVFLVLNRATNSIPNDFTTWGRNAVVCDPWGGAVFPAVEIPKKLNCLKNYRFSSGKDYDVWYGFNKKFHQLSNTRLNNSLRLEEREVAINLKALEQVCNAYEQKNRLQDSELKEIKEIYDSLFHTFSRNDVIFRLTTFFKKMLEAGKLDINNLMFQEMFLQPLKRSVPAKFTPSLYLDYIQVFKQLTDNYKASSVGYFNYSVLLKSAMLAGVPGIEEEFFNLVKTTGLISLFSPLADIYELNREFDKAANGYVDFLISSKLSKNNVSQLTSILFKLDSIFENGAPDIALKLAKVMANEFDDGKWLQIQDIVHYLILSSRNGNKEATNLLEAIYQSKDGAIKIADKILDFTATKKEVANYLHPAKELPYASYLLDKGFSLFDNWFSKSKLPIKKEKESSLDMDDFVALPSSKFGF